MKTKNIFLTVALGLFTTFAFAQTITGSSHDFGSAVWNNGNGTGTTASGQICNACHSPHRGTGGLASPLWSRNQTISGFTAYTSTTFTADDAATGEDEAIV